MSGVPRRRSSLIGRQTEVAELVAALDDHELVTLTGAGGVGKSSVAIEAARVVAEAGTEVHVVDVAEVSDGVAVSLAVTDELGIAPASGLDPVDALVSAFTLGEPPLVVLDNADQRLDEVADLVDDLLDASADLHVVVTSRMRLDVEGEHVRPIGALGVAVAAGGPGPAVDLLAERARAAGAALGPADGPRLAEIARRLDGVPLALELAAARLATRSGDERAGPLETHLPALEGRRRRSAERHRSLGSVVEWSLDLLDSTERDVFAALSVFVGGFERDAVVEVAGEAAERALAPLVEASLLERLDVDGTARHRMLEMVRVVAREHLMARSDCREVEERHARWATALVSGLVARSHGPDERAATAALVRELPNVGAALRWSAEAGELDLVDQLCFALAGIAYVRPSSEIDAWVASAVDALDEPFELEGVLLASAMTAQRRGDLDRTVELVAEAARRGYEALGAAMSFGSLRGALTLFGGDLEGAIAQLTDAAEAQREVHPAASMMSQGFAALPMAYLGRYEEALPLAEEAAEGLAAVAWPTGMAAAAYVQAEALIGIDPPAALRAYRRCVTMAQEVDSAFFLGMGRVSWASALARYGDPAEAFELFEDAIEELRAKGSWSYLSTTLRNLGELLVRVERYEDSHLIRTAAEHLTGGTAVSGVDADRDAYLRALLRDRLLAARYDELADEARAMSREQVVRRALAVIAEERAARTTGTGIRAVVFTDLVGATAFMAEAGDERAREVMRRYESLTEDLLARHGGSRVKGTGDGMLVTFSSVSDALACVGSLLDHIDERPDELPLAVRVGVHAGEMIDETEMAEGDDIHGTVVNLTARVVDRADGGEVVVTDTARQIVVGAGLAFTALGDHDLKGIAEPVRLHRLERGRSVG